MEPLWLPLVIAVVVMLLLFRASKVVPVGHVFLVERLGRYRTSLKPGIHLTVPVIDTVRATLDTREQMFSTSREPVVTKDNHVLAVDAGVHYEITDPRAAVYEVADHLQALDTITVSTLRTVIGGMDREEALMSSQVIGTELRRVLNWTTGTWGVRVNRADITALDEAGQL
ncbi:SPFH domain-containing protein [Tessaracoccus antarcticus]|uniref:Band 7 domain-containing protein n=1 Tax=Tessaracoccus antarcticus TaxID=2479848 RepID=A0A3M0G4V0_9ACTN|nr:SPFH domain-containing protein [Tessaracoccus antarcticus]RMB59864.1 hypothetical protein EAX62_08980 [Tessaracoccus antarcticus]